MFRHVEYSIRVLAPDTVAQCVWTGCHDHNASFRMVVFTDRDEIAAEYSNICDRHMVAAFLDASDDVADREANRG
jgi:hypothetical protein